MDNVVSHKKMLLIDVGMGNVKRILKDLPLADRYDWLKRHESWLEDELEGLRAELLEQVKEGEVATTSDGRKAFVLVQVEKMKYTREAIEYLKSKGLIHHFVNISKKKLDDLRKDKQLTYDDLGALQKMATISTQEQLREKVLEPVISDV